MKNAYALSAVAALVAATGTASAAFINIDTFEVDQTLQANAADPNTQTTVSGPGIIGDYRDSYLEYLSGPGNANLDADFTEAGVMLFSLNSSTRGSASIVWDGDNDGDDEFPVLTPATVVDIDGLGGVDLTDGGLNDRIEIVVSFSDAVSFLTLRVWDLEGDLTNAVDELDFMVMADGDAIQTIELPFEDFDIDFSQVGAIELEINPLSPATDLQFEVIRAVPSPGGSILLSTAGLMLAARRKR
jgi:hypothetical protein